MTSSQPLEITCEAQNAGKQLYRVLAATIFIDGGLYAMADIYRDLDDCDAGAGTYVALGYCRKTMEFMVNFPVSDVYVQRMDCIDVKRTRSIECDREMHDFDDPKIQRFGFIHTWAVQLANAGLNQDWPAFAALWRSARAIDESRTRSAVSETLVITQHLLLHTVRDPGEVEGNALVA